MDPYLLSIFRNHKFILLICFSYYSAKVHIIVLFSSTGYFYLTPDYGMDLIRNCTGRGFHEHPMHTPIFEVRLNLYKAEL